MKHLYEDFLLISGHEARTNIYLSLPLLPDSHPYSCFTQSKYRKKFLFTTVELSKRTDRQRFGSDGWKLAFLDIDTMHLNMDTQRYNSPHLAHTLFWETI